MTVWLILAKNVAVYKCDYFLTGNVWDMELPLTLPSVLSHSPGLRGLAV